MMGYDNGGARVVTALIELMRSDPFGWEADNYTLVHPKSNLSVWIGNGWIFCRPWKPELPLSLYQRWRLWRAAKQLREEVVVRAAVKALHSLEVSS